MTEPQTEAGRAFCAALRANRVWPIKKPMNTTPEAAILAIEAQARHAALAEVRRGVEAALTAHNPERYDNGRDFESNVEWLGCYCGWNSDRLGPGLWHDHIATAILDAAETP